MRDVATDGYIAWSGVARTELPGQKAPDWVEVGDLLVIARGSRYYAAFVDYVPGPTVCGPHLFQIRLKPGGKVLPGFLAWQMNQAPLQRVLRKAAQGSGQLSISRTELEALPISVPPLPDQEKIVQLARLALRERDLFTSLIRNRERQLETLATNLSNSVATREPRP